MKFNLSSSILFSFATSVSVTLGSIVIPLNLDSSATAKEKPASSNMVYPIGTAAQQGSAIEKAKAAMFKDGDYVLARQYLEVARKTQPNEPLVYALSTLYSFRAKDLPQTKRYSEQTSKAARGLMKTNPVRGNLYQGVGVAIAAVYDMMGEHPLGALNKLSSVFKYMDAAKKLNPNDPELNMVRGYLDLLLAVNVPFADANQAIEQLEKAEPKYLAYRGIYIGYRDLKEYDKAIEALNKAIELAPNNPEFIYYQAQILAIRGVASQPQNDRDLRKSIKLFDDAYQKSDRLLSSTVTQIKSERCQAQSALDRVKPDACFKG